MVIIFIIIGIIASVIVGRIAFGRWFNHVGLYGIIWGFTLLVFESGLIYYYPFENETRFYIACSWFVFIVGSLTSVLVRWWFPSKEFVKQEYDVDLLDKAVTKTLILLNLVGLFVTVHTWIICINRYGGILNVIILGNIVRDDFIHNRIPGMIYYFPALIQTGNLYVGISFAINRKLSCHIILSILLNLLYSIVTMSRSSLLMGALLVFSGYMITSLYFASKRKIGMIKKIVVTLILVLSIVGVEEIVRSNRGLYEIGYSNTSRIKRISKNIEIPPTIIFYLSAHLGVFNQYLKENVEHGLPAQFTLSTMWRLLDKFGMETPVPYTQRFYRIPDAANTGTYLREVHSDFGIFGITLVPYLLGMVCSFYLMRAKERGKLIDVIILSHLYVVIGMSFILWMISQGIWILSLLGGLVFGSFTMHLYKKYLYKKATL